jgi:hypothetical protein
LCIHKITIVYTKSQSCVYTGFLFLTTPFPTNETLKAGDVAYVAYCMKGGGRSAPTAGCRRPYNPAGGDGYCNNEKQKYCFYPKDFVCTCLKTHAGVAMDRAGSEVLKRSSCICPAPEFEAACAKEAEVARADRKRRRQKHTFKEAESCDEADGVPLPPLTSEILLTVNQAEAQAEDGTSRLQVQGTDGARSAHDLDFESFLTEHSLGRCGANRDAMVEQTEAEVKTENVARRVWMEIRCMHRLTNDIGRAAMAEAFSIHEVSLSQ